LFQLPLAGASLHLKFLKWLQQYWTKRIDDENERLKFILASYNAGVGHVEDTQRLTEKFGGNPDVWEDVAYWLLQKSTRQYSSDEVVKFGFCRGLEPVNYVSHILERFEHYKQFVVARATTGAASQEAKPQKVREQLLQKVASQVA
jgi:membrane-bound lytic murein transglycosylase F